MLIVRAEGEERKVKEYSALAISIVKRRCGGERERWGKSSERKVARGRGEWETKSRG